MSRSLTALAIWLWAMVPSASMAREALFDAPALSDDELADARGGFILDSGARVDFGAVITTTVDGMRVLETQWRLTMDGAIGRGGTARDVSVMIERSDGTVTGSGGKQTAGSIEIPSPSFGGGDSPANEGGVSIAFSGETANAASSAPQPTDGSVRASVELPDLAIYHEIGQTISSVVINTGNNRIIDNDVVINLRLDNVQPFSLGSAGFQVQNLSLDAALLRQP